MISLRDVARACGVSPMTVSYVINDRTDRVSAETRERVLEAIRELGYRPPNRRRTRARGFTVGLVTGTSAHSLRTPGYHQGIAQGIIEATEAYDCHLLLFHQSLFHQQDIAQSLRVYCDGCCDGLIVLAPPIGNPTVPALLERGFPVMVIGDGDPESPADFVDVDNEAIGREAAELLLTRGCRRLALFHTVEIVRSSRQRRAGFRAAARAASLAPEACIEAVVTPDLPGSLKAALSLLSRPPEQRPNGVFAWNDETSLWVYDAAIQLGLRVPEDLRIVGVDDLEEARTHGLSTFSQPYDEMTNLAVATLLRRIRGEKQPPQHLFLKATLLSRSST